MIIKIKFLANRTKRFFLIPFFVFLYESSLSSVIYDKKDILITEIDLMQFKDIYLKINNIKIDDLEAIKEIVLIENTLNRLKKNQPQFINNIDQIIYNQYNEDIYSSEIAFNFLRFIKVREEFILVYFKNDLNEEDLKNVINTFEEFKLPISLNDCNTLIDFIDFKNNENFIKIFLKNLKLNEKEYVIEINNTKYNICISIENFEIIEVQLIKYIEEKTKERFNRFIYGK